MHHIDPAPSPQDGIRAGEPPYRQGMSEAAPDVPWYKLLTRYHWFVLIVSVLGWMFDCLDQQLFNLARAPAIGELMGPQYVQWYGGLATTIFMIGWATGGIVFGVMGDRYGRAKTMVITILIYSLFTGLSSFSWDFASFAFFRFLTGLGVGGEFAVGVALVAEVMPDRARTPALGWLQACSAVGNVTAAFIGMALSAFEAAGELGAVQPWRIMFLIGALPALLALVIRRQLKEPERWQQLRDDPNAAKNLGSFSELLSHATWRRHAFLGLILATSGVVGLWGIGFFGFELVRAVFRPQFTNEARTTQALTQDQSFVRLVLADPEREETIGTGDKQAKKKRFEFAKEKIKPDHLLDKNSATIYEAMLALAAAPRDLTREAVLAKAGEKTQDLEALTKLLNAPAPADDGFAEAYSTITARTQDIASRLTFWVGIYGLLFNIGAFFGIYAFAKITPYLGRRPAFAITFLLALLTTAFTFWNLDKLGDIFWMVPVMGFAQIALFGGYAVYFPELFPTRLRSTGISFCYNIGRYVASIGPLMLGTLASTVFGVWGGFGELMSLRWAGVTMCSFFLLGLAVLPFLPETKGKPLPE